MKTSALAVLGFAASTLASVLPRGTCAKFTALPSTSNSTAYLLQSPQSFRISVGATCVSQNCSLAYGGYVTDTRSLNITTDTTTATNLYSLIHEATSVSLNASTTGNVTTGEAEWTLHQNETGYVTFTPQHTCITGNLTGCSGGLLDGTIVEACGPTLLSSLLDWNNYPFLLGTITFQTVSAQEIASNSSYEINPANTTRSLGSDTSTTPTASSSSAAAPMLVVSSGFSFAPLGVALAGMVFGGLLL